MIKKLEKEKVKIGGERRSERLGKIGSERRVVVKIKLLSTIMAMRKYK
jgi:hypothetical protein